MLGNEKKESFQWLLHNLMCSVGGHLPHTIMTDQCLAMDWAIERTLPQTQDRLCIWHILQNLKSNVGSSSTLLPNKDTYEVFVTQWTRFTYHVYPTDTEWYTRWEQLTAACRHVPYIVTSLFSLRFKWAKTLSRRLTRYQCVLYPARGRNER